MSNEESQACDNLMPATLTVNIGGQEIEMRYDEESGQYTCELNDLAPLTTEITSIADDVPVARIPGSVYGASVLQGDYRGHNQSWWQAVDWGAEGAEAAARVAATREAASGIEAVATPASGSALLNDVIDGACRRLFARAGIPSAFLQDVSSGPSNFNSVTAASIQSPTDAPVAEDSDESPAADIPVPVTNRAQNVTGPYSVRADGQVEINARQETARQYTTAQIQPVPHYAENTAPPANSYRETRYEYWAQRRAMEPPTNYVIPAGDVLRCPPEEPGYYWVNTGSPGWCMMVVSSLAAWYSHRLRYQWADSVPQECKPQPWFTYIAICRPVLQAAPVVAAPSVSLRQPVPQSRLLRLEAD